MEPNTVWCTEYRKHRNYGHLSNEQLSARYSSLLENSVQFDDFGRPFIARDDRLPRPKQLCWVEEEFRLRSMEWKASELEHFELGRNRPNVRAAQVLWSRVPPPAPDSYIVKFALRPYVEEMLARGRFRIAPAHSYNDSSLNSAARDDELLTEHLTPNGTRLYVKLDGEFQEIHGIVGPLHYKRRCDNYYVFCAAHRFEPRLFDDFDADACLVVRDCEEFARRLMHGVAHVAGMARCACGNVQYIDPFDQLTSSDSSQFVEMSKNFRFEYQAEWRMVWKGDQPLPMDAPPLFVELGPLADCCEAYYL